MRFKNRIVVIFTTNNSENFIKSLPRKKGYPGRQDTHKLLKWGFSIYIGREWSPHQDSHGKTALGTVLSPLLSFGNMEHLAHCDVGERTPSHFEKADKIFSFSGGNMVPRKKSGFKVMPIWRVSQRNFFYLLIKVTIP